MMFNNKNLERIHFIGVAGIGMSGLAEILLGHGFAVSGSDKNYNKNVEKLEKKGLMFFRGHHSESVAHAQLVIISTAINSSNPELAYAREYGIPVIRRGQLLAQLMLQKNGLAVSGTHGKTTTTSMLATILVENNYDPSVLVGGNVVNLEGNARLGKGDFFVSEADESDGSFLWLNPVAMVVTNIDTDHLDHYGNMDKLKQAFLQFIHKTPYYGICAINKDDAILSTLIPMIEVPFSTFGLMSDADYTARNIHHDLEGSSYELYYLNESVATIELALPGRHNVLNSLGAIAIAHNIGLGFGEIAHALKSFKGVGRRLEKIRQVNRMMIIDDYAHHPTAIKTTLATLREMTKKKIIAVFEPHRYTRTQKCWSEFLHCFEDADHVFIAPIYAANEVEIPGINTSELVAQIQVNTEVPVKEMDSVDELYNLVLRFKEQDCVLITLGAGPLSTKIRDVVNSI
ncbi:MAG: UDP-N-acetylmuramate--L-alanine ligase [Bacteriovoracaceae bacterium]